MLPCKRNSTPKSGVKKATSSSQTADMSGVICPGWSRKRQQRPVTFQKTSKNKKLSKDEAWGLADFQALSWGLNSQGKAERARKVLGWQPREISLEDEVPAIVEQEKKRLSWATTTTPSMTKDGKTVLCFRLQCTSSRSPPWREYLIEQRISRSRAWKEFCPAWSDGASSDEMRIWSGKLRLNQVFQFPRPAYSDVEYSRNELKEVLKQTPFSSYHMMIFFSQRKLSLFLVCESRIFIDICTIIYTYTIPSSSLPIPSYSPSLPLRPTRVPLSHLLSHSPHKSHPSLKISTIPPIAPKPTNRKNPPTSNKKANQKKNQNLPFQNPQTPLPSIFPLG